MRTAQRLFKPLNLPQEKTSKGYEQISFLLPICYAGAADARCQKQSERSGISCFKLYGLEFNFFPSMQGGISNIILTGVDWVSGSERAGGSALSF